MTNNFLLLSYLTKTPETCVIFNKYTRNMCPEVDNFMISTIFSEQLFGHKASDSWAASIMLSSLPCTEYLHQHFVRTFVDAYICINKYTPKQFLSKYLRMVLTFFQEIKLLPENHVVCQNLLSECHKLWDIQMHSFLTFFKTNHFQKLES